MTPRWCWGQSGSSVKTSLRQGFTDVLVPTCSDSNTGAVDYTSVHGYLGELRPNAAQSSKCVLTPVPLRSCLLLEATRASCMLPRRSSAFPAQLFPAGSSHSAAPLSGVAAPLSGVPVELSKGQPPLCLQMPLLLYF